MRRGKLKKRKKRKKKKEKSNLTWLNLDRDGEHRLRAELIVRPWLLYIV